MPTHKVYICKSIDWKDGEELRELPSKIMAALGRSKLKMKKSLFLTHIFKKEIGVMDWETGKRFIMSIERTGEDTFKFGKPVPARLKLVPIQTSVKKDEEGVEVEETDEPEVVEIQKSDLPGFWGGTFSLK